MVDDSIVNAQDEFCSILTSTEPQHTCQRGPDSHGSARIMISRFTSWENKLSSIQKIDVELETDPLMVEHDYFDAYIGKLSTILVRMESTLTTFSRSIAIPSRWSTYIFGQ